MNRPTRATAGRHGRHPLYLGCSAAILAATAIGPARAQTTLDTIVVTAERRETSLQETPLSIIAFSAENMEMKGVDDVGDLAMFTPNLEIKGSRGDGNNVPTFESRGVSGGGVGIYIDDVYVSSTNIAVLRTLDFERIEVLRGPQGTLFGRNSTGGAVRMFTQQPTNEFEGYARITGGNFDRRDLVGMLNIPLTDNFFIRGQGAYLNEDGYVERGTQMLGGSEDVLGRLQTRWEASDTVTASFGFLYSNSESEGSPQDIMEFDMRPGLEGVWEGNYGDWVSDFLETDGQDPIAPYNDERFVLDDFTMPNFCFIDDADPDWDEACELSNNAKYMQADAHIEWQISPNLTLDSITGYTKMEVSGYTDWQQIGTERRPNNDDTEALYQEFQLTTALFDNAVDLVTGANYYHEKSKTFGHNTTRRGTSIADPFYQDPVTGVYGHPNGNGDAGLFILNDTSTTLKSDSLGVFGNATWHITNGLNFTGGLRFTYDKRDVRSTEQASGDFTPAPGTNSTTVTSDKSWTQIDWRATLDYQFTDSHMAYVTASKAYKAGAFSFTILDEIPGDQQSGDFISPIAPEKVVNFEAGARTEWFDNRLRINPTVFYMMWTNRQAARQVDCSDEGPDTCPIGFRPMVVDSGDVDLYGLELDAQLALTERLSFDGGLGISDYKIKDEAANSGPYLFPAPSLLSYNVGGSYYLPVDDYGSLTFGLNWIYQGSQQTHPTADSDSSYKLPSYGLLSGRIRWTTEDERVSLVLYANNILDNTYATYATRFGGGYWDAGGPPRGGAAPLRSALSATRGRPFNWGATLQYNF